MKPRFRITLQVTLVFVLFAAILLAGAGVFAYTNGYAAKQARRNCVRVWQGEPE